MFEEINTSKELNDVEMFKMVMRNRATSLPQSFSRRPDKQPRAYESIFGSYPTNQKEVQG